MRSILLIIFLINFFIPLMAQDSAYHASVEVQGVLTTSGHVPFWMRSDQFGSIPLAGTSGSLIGAAGKKIDPSKLFDWGASMEWRADLGNSSRLTLIEGLAKVKLSIFELEAGRAREIMGLVDTSLSSGAFSISGNALGIPKLQLSVPDFWSLPVFGGIFALKGNFAIGWVGVQPLGYTHFVTQAQTYFHQSSLYGRFGKPGWKIKLIAGINHQVYWGSERAIFGPDYNLSALKSFEYVVLGKTWVGSKVGNHIGSVDIGMQYDFPSLRLCVYRQNFYDEGALAKLANIADGLNGVSLVNLKEGHTGLRWHKLLFEYLYSLDQAGYPSSIPTASGDENYYNNYEYSKGWSYHGLGLGNPFMTTVVSTRSGLPNDPVDYFNNNRVAAFYTGIEGGAGKYCFKTRLSYSLNYGTFGTSPWGHSTGRVYYSPRYGLFGEVSQFSSYVEFSRSLNSGWVVGATAGFDSGRLLDNSTGIILSAKRSF